MTSELRELANTLGFDVVATFTQKRANFDSAAYLGTGKRDEIRRFVQGEPDDADAPEAAAIGTLLIVRALRMTSPAWSSRFMGKR